MHGSWVKRGMARGGSAFLPLFLNVLVFIATAFGADVGVLDRVTEEQFRIHHVPGGVLVVVQDGEVVFSRGYGYAVRDLKKEVSAETTLFRVGSIAKIATAAVLLQLVEEGRISPAEDVRSLLPPRIRRLFVSPVNISHLLTHTSGLDNSDIADAARNPAMLVDLRVQLERRTPGVVFPPETAFHYSNYNYAAAGYLIEEITGMRYGEAMQRYLFQKLGMNHSTFAAVPEAGLSAVASGYSYRKGEFRELELDYSQVPSADGLFTTGRDMGTFLCALLPKESAASPLSSFVRSSMLQQQYSFHPMLDGVAFPFFVQSGEGGHHSLTYTGGQLGFTSQVLLVPESRVAFFVSYNVRTSRPRQEIARVFLNEYLQEKGRRAELSPIPSSDSAESLEGTYRYTGGTQTTLEKVWYLLGFYSDLHLKADGAGLTAAGKEYNAVAADVYCAGAGDCGVFRNTGKGLYLGVGIETYRRLPWYERAKMHRTAAAVCLLLFLTSLIRPGRRWSLNDTRAGRFGVISLRWASLLLFLFTVAFGIFLKWNGTELDYGVPLIGRLLLWLPILSVPLAFNSILTFYAVWRGARSFSARAHYVAVLCALLIYYLILGYWNLFGFHYPS